MYDYQRTVNIFCWKLKTVTNWISFSLFAIRNKKVAKTHILLTERGIIKLMYLPLFSHVNSYNPNHTFFSRSPYFSIAVSLPSIKEACLWTKVGCESLNLKMIKKQLKKFT